MTSTLNVLTIGTFDLTHVGHVDFLKICANMGRLVVGVNTDEFVKQFKPAPIMTVDERMHAIEQLGYPAVKNESAGRELIEKLNPDLLVIGSDWARKDYLGQIDVTQDWLDENNIILAYVPYKQTFEISSTIIRKRIRDAIKAES